MSTPPAKSDNSAANAASPAAQQAAHPRIFESYDLQGVADYIKQNKPTKILVMLGAGVSVAAGIPDFRTPGVGLYSRLADRFPELAERPEQLFGLDAFKRDPALFYRVMNEMKMWPDTYVPTASHRFVRLLQDKGLLLRCYTQNIDTLERSAGIEEDLLVEAHGAFATAHCVTCKKAVPIAHVRESAESGAVPKCTDIACKGVAKPDVVFFGEALPERFTELVRSDAQQCDLLIIIGTSLQVMPFAAIPSIVGSKTPRVQMNMERVGGRSFVLPEDVASSTVPSSADSTDAAPPCPLLRDIVLAGDCQKTVVALAKALDWGELPPPKEEGPN